MEWMEEDQTRRLGTDETILQKGTTETVITGDQQENASEVKATRAMGKAQGPVEWIDC